tara:strand:- start:221 stop:403 length:183 start_codon:yes stop_codon:yes gene_type:complete
VGRRLRSDQFFKFYFLDSTPIGAPSDTYTYTYSDTYTYPDTYTDTYTYTNADAYTYTWQQ